MHIPLAVTVPRSCAAGNDSSDVDSSTTEPYPSENRSFSGTLTSTPRALPIAILTSASATPPYESDHADTTLPSEMQSRRKFQLALSCSVSGMRLASGVWRRRYRRLPGALNSGDMTLRASTVVMPNATRVGGTCMCSKVPLMESFPPIEGSPSSACILSVPRRAARGLPQVWGSCVMRSKYSWYEKRIPDQSAPEHATLVHASTTAYAAE